MSALLLNLTALERLSAMSTALPTDFARALGEDLEYARFGAALPELPWFGAIASGVQAFLGRGTAPHFAVQFRDQAPVAFGLKAAELVSNGALMGKEAGLAFVAGYFTQLCVSRALEPLTASLVRTQRASGEDEAQARERITWVQSLLLIEELHGSMLVGTPAVRAKLQVRKANSIKGIGRGLYELMRVASLEAHGEAPSKGQVDDWVRGLFTFSWVLGTPLGRWKGLRGVNAAQRELYRSEGVDVWGALEAGLARTRLVLSLLSGLIRRGSFTARSRARVLALLPEGPPSVGLPEIAADAVDDDALEPQSA